jgi:hypothetical protein
VVKPLEWCRLAEIMTSHIIDDNFQDDPQITEARRDETSNREVDMNIDRWYIVVFSVANQYQPHPLGHDIR